MTDYAELKRLAEAATQGSWQVIETELPCRLGRPHVERRIFTTKDHPQLKAPYPVVNGSVALGTDETPVHHMVSMTAKDAAFIASANPVAVLALIAENERSKEKYAEAGRLYLEMAAERDHLKAENEHQAAQFKEWQANHHANYCSAAGERDHLKAENARLREECARLEADNQSLLEHPEDAL